MAARLKSELASHALGQHIDHDQLIAGIIVEQVQIDPAQGIGCLALPANDNMKFGMIVVVVQLVATVMHMVVAVMLVLMLVAVLVVMTMIVGVMVITVMIMLVMVVARVGLVVTVMTMLIAVVLVAESMGMRVDRGQLTAPSLVDAQPLCPVQCGQHGCKLIALTLIARRMLEPDQVDTGDFQLQAQIALIQGQVSNRLPVHVGIVLAQGISGKLAGQAKPSRQSESQRLHVCVQFFHDLIIR